MSAGQVARTAYFTSLALRSARSRCGEAARQAVNELRSAVVLLAQAGDTYRAAESPGTTGTLPSSAHAIDRANWLENGNPAS